ncbi:golgin subfamily A member 5 [Drosophila kikkawai]|uniref:Golgin subfamily A member 5 n=1 Tax=Drosophila kikkawai TaxID=30033 RepID=A0A6P4HQR2_DROKI|nr:uncharacterized protein LOC108071609 [Drosophila kikkawai]
MSCWVPGLSQSESEITLEKSVFQEEASNDSQLEESYQQLERMKQRVLQMKSKLVHTLSKESGSDQVPFQSDNANLREIQLETLQGFQQIEVVKSRLRETTEELSLVSERIEESRCCADKLMKQLDEVPKWIEEHKHQVEVCLERHNELDTSYCSDLDYRSQIQPLQRTLKNLYRARVPLRCYKIEHMDMRNRLKRTLHLLHQTRRKLMHAIRKMNKTLESAKTSHMLISLVDPPEKLKTVEHQLKEQESGLLARPSWISRLPKLEYESTHSLKQLVTEITHNNRN